MEADIIPIPAITDSQSNTGSLSSALVRSEDIKEISDNKKFAVFLDYDGTLTPIVERPELAVMSESMRETLKDLATYCTVSILSGRDLEDVKSLVGLDPLLYGGSHGFDIAAPGYQQIRHEKGTEFIPALERVAQALKKKLEPIHGAVVEHKKFSIAVHFRQAADDDVPKIEAGLDEVLEEFEEFRKSTGKKVFELKPAIDWHKGKALLWLLEKLQLDRPDVLPIYIGDDTTDEDAFRELGRIGGLGVIVRDKHSRPTYAHFAVDSTEEVRQFLQFLTGTARETRHQWWLTYTGFIPTEEGLREALCTLGNGYFATRGAAAESHADDIHYPGMYLAGGYNRLGTEVAGRIIVNEDLVNMPNWLPVQFRIDGGRWVELKHVDILMYRQELDIKSGILHREVRFRDKQGRESILFCRRFVHMENAHMAAEEINLMAVNWSGEVDIRSALDGTVTNAGVERYKDLNSRHLRPMEAFAVNPETLYLKVRTSQSDIRVALAARTRVFNNLEPIQLQWQHEIREGYIEQTARVSLHTGDTLTVEKIVSLYTSRDYAISECGLEARSAVKRAGSFHDLLMTHIRAWWHLWRRFNVQFRFENRDGDNRIGLITHLYIFHILQTVSLHTIDIDVGVPARGWHGEAYRGHIFWDELFIFPFLNFRLPEITRSLLMYRYYRLDAARQAAKNAGHEGAMYPWQSGSNGREETQVVHYNPKSGRWLPDNSHLQRHVNIAIAYNLWLYYQVTDDIEFMSFYGAEMLLEIARFLASLTSYDKASNRYEMKNVMGPDEYHDAYPDSDEPGLNNNTYTNVMTVWVLSRALWMLDIIPLERRLQLCSKLNLNSAEMRRWDAVSRKMKVVFIEDNVLAQFEGFDKLEEFDWPKYRAKYGDIHRLDRILEAEGDTPNRYKLSKQADTLMLFYLLSAEELDRLFDRLGYTFDPEWIPKTISYYLKRTSHGSTLSRVVHSWVLARATRAGSWSHFCEALKSDIEDIQGGTTKEGIHLGAMAGTVDMVTRGYTGLEVRDRVLRFNPCLPEELEFFHMHLRYRGHTLEIDVDSETLRIYVLPSDQPPIKISHNEQEYVIGPGQMKEFPVTCSVPMPIEMGI
ncbi:MAG: trehalose-phosphatase [Desulfobacterales bacterium]